MKAFALLFVAVLMLQANAAQADATRAARSCQAGSAQPVREPRMLAAIAQAREEHRLFGGQLIERRGGIVRVGFHEAEFDRLKTESTPTWKRVAQFWKAVDEDLPPDFRSPAENRVNRQMLFERIAAFGNENGLRALDEKERDAIQSAFLRTALVDHPWSAAFITFLLKTSGFSKSEFEFSDSHVDYVDQAFLASLAESRAEPTESAYRACDVATTRPRAGDLICFTRERSADITSFVALRAQLETRRSAARADAIPMHCDLVTSADDNGDSKIETIGGNVFQSVTLRQMTLNAGKTLSSTYFRLAQQASCTRTNRCGPNLSSQRWVVLLQFRK